jgi:hypothetical protein
MVVEETIIAIERLAARQGKHRGPSSAWMKEAVHETARPAAGRQESA